MPFGDNKRVANTAQWRAARRMVERLTCVNKARRARLEKNTDEWLKYYLPHAYPLPFGQVHLDIISGAENALLTGGKFVVAAPRGTGKSSILWGVALKFKLTGRVKFPALLPWKASDLRKALRFWKNALCFNAKLLADYPEYCQPFHESRGSSMKCVTLTWGDTGEPTGAELRISDGMMVFPDGLGAIGSSTINGNPRGLNHSTEDGRVLRPDLVFIDDPQDKEVAKSVMQTASIIDVIDTDVMGMAGPDQRMPMLLSCTVMQDGDVASHYLGANDWTAVKVGQIKTWPERMNLWERFGEMINDKREPEALIFYKANKDEMQKGMEVSWDARFDKKRKEPDAFYSAMRDFYFMGRSAFMAERQNQPVSVTTSQYELTSAIVLSRKSGLPRLSAPQGSVLCCGIDINYVGFNWVIVASESVTGSRKVVAYGQWPDHGGLIPKGVTDQQACALIRRGMGQFAVMLGGVRINCGDRIRGLDSACWDASNGKWQDAIAAAAREVRVAQKHYVLKAFSAKYYHPRRTDLRQGKGWHISDFPRIGRVLVVNADYWRETMQRGFLVEPTEAGALSLYDSPAGTEHSDLAAQIAGQSLVEHVTTDRMEYYTWNRKVGVPDHKPDALVYACALTGVEGIGEDKLQQKRHVETRKAKFKPGDMI